MRQEECLLIRSALAALYLASVAAAADVDEFKIKREAVFEFAQKPVVTRNGDNVTIAFESKGLCDATVAIEDANGRIIRHLASGVLGPKAPAPFQKDSKKQAVAWDGKSDQGVYVDDKDSCTVRVSLGLKPEFEKTLFWSPQKRIGTPNSPIIRAAPEGVYVTEGCGVDSVRLYDHDGEYLRTIYPFPREKLAELKGVETAVFPQDGLTLPIKRGPKHASTLLRSGGLRRTPQDKYGMATAALAVQGSRIALPGYSLTRMATDGTTGGLDLNGPDTALEVKVRGGEVSVAPRNAAFSPDGKWLYLTGYFYAAPYPEPQEWIPCVMKLEYAGEGKLELFAGSSKLEDARSRDQAFAVPSSVACDIQGRVYVADYMNNRIQVYTPDGKLSKSVPAPYPVQVEVSPKTGEIYVFSWVLENRFLGRDVAIQATISRLGSIDDPSVKATHKLPLNDYADRSGSRTGHREYRVAVDFWGDSPTIWVLPGLMFRIGDQGVKWMKNDLRGTGMLLLKEEGGKLALKRDFNNDVVKSVVRAIPPGMERPRLYVHPVNGKLYVGETDCGDGKAFQQLVEIDPKTGKVTLMNLPMATEDLAIDLNGLFYLRSDIEVGRFDPVSWREVPWDYGEERAQAGFGCTGGRMCSLNSDLILPGTGRPGWWHLGGMAVSPKGNLAVTCYNSSRPLDRRETGENPYSKIYNSKAGGAAGGKYTPQLYPGRAIGWETHIWDTHGKVIYDDATPGFGVTDGIGLDANDNLYVLANPNRVLDGKPYFLPWATTLVKVVPKKTRLLTQGSGVPVPLGAGGGPARPRDVDVGWIENAEWMYGGVGFAGWRTGASCICWNARPALDLFARSFAPEISHYSVAVLDSNGNLVLRVGQYGNVDDGKPLVPEGGPANPRSIGGDEVALFHPAYLATHSDRRLFIADIGNARIVSVKLGYHAEEKAALKDVADPAGK